MRTTTRALLYLQFFLFCVFAGQATVASGEETDSQSIQIDLNIGEIVEFAEGNDEVAAILQRAIQELADGVRVQNLDEAIAAANEVVGMDIKKDVHSLSVNLGSGFSLKGDFALDVAPVYAVLHTAKQGNLEGLLLMSPTYKSEGSSDDTLHVMQVGPNQNVYLKFIESSSDVFTVAAMDQSRLHAVGKKLASQQLSPSDISSNELARATVGRETFEKVAAELSAANSSEANIVRNIISDMQELSLSISREGDGVSLELNSLLGSKEKAKQQFQALQGGKAIAKMLLDEENADPQVVKLIEILDSVKIDLDDKTVSLRLSVPSISQAIKLVDSI